MYQQHKYWLINKRKELILTFRIYKQQSILIKCQKQRGKSGLLCQYNRIIKVNNLQPKLTKLIDRNKEEIIDLVKKFQIKILGFLKRMNQYQQ
ncbi:unnamed protein product [Paramecium octaurelia]|uniref:Uncharacterized protein n=1 Tax=Paramecium octaurelia TaxID=43137 RepID=A0A8S1WD09_PAROT|nr:unnamed protein product [Paramecium octaurelia]